MIKNAIAKAGFSLVDFSGWMQNKKFDKLEHVRSLPSILKDERARKTFLSEGSAEALKVLDRPEANKVLEEAEVGALARALRQRIDSLPFTEVERLRDDPSASAVRYLLEARNRISSFLASNDLE
jgi:hypothetical protein